MNATARKRLTALGGTIVVGYGGWQAYLWYLRNEPLDKAALNFVSAFERADAKTLRFYSMSGELEGYTLSNQGFDNVLKQYVFPGFKSIRPDRSIPQWNAGGKEYVLVKFYKVDDREIKLIVITRRTRKGPKASILDYGTLFEWERRYGAKFAGQTLHRQRFGTMLEGATQDRSQLEALGIKGLIYWPPGSQIRSWDRLVLGYQRGMNTR